MIMLRCRPGRLRAAVAAVLVLASTLVGVTIVSTAAAPMAFAAGAAQGQGADGSFSASLAESADGGYAVRVSAANSHPDVTTSSVEMEVVDDVGTRNFRNQFSGGRIQATLTFDSRGPCAVRIVFRFTRDGGQEQSNADRPVTLSHPSGPDAGGPAEPAPAAEPGPTEDAAACVTPPGMTGLVDQDTSDSQRPWKRPDGSSVQINFVVDGSITPDWRAYLDHGAAAWNKSPCLDVRVVDGCPSGGNCVSVSALDDMDADGNFDAVEKGGFTTGGKITLLNKLNANQRRNVAVHEMGHAVGLVHRRAGHVMMNADTFDDVFDPDATDYKNLLFSYDRMQRRP